MAKLVYSAVLLLLAAGTAFGTGEVSLVDSGDLEYFINTDIPATTVSMTTSSSLSGAISEASFTSLVSGVTTSLGGTTTTTLSDAFDGYNALWVNVDGEGWAGYAGNGEPTPADEGRTLVFNEQTINEVDVYRKVFVPEDDQFCRWLNVFTNNGSSTKTIQVDIYSNLGSDEDTLIYSTSDGNRRAQLRDAWVVTYEDFDAGFSGDPRLGHVMQGPEALGMGCARRGGVPVPLSEVFFEDEDGFPYWSYEFELGAGETVILMNFVTGQPTLEAAEAQAEALANLEGSALDNMSVDELQQVVNFIIAPGKRAEAESSAMVFGGNIVLLGGVVLVLLNRRGGKKNSLK